MSLRLLIEKVTVMPPVITPDTLYFVLNGEGFDMKLSNKAGTQVITLNQPAVEAGVDQFLLMGVGVND
jgi:hypothetical protein